MLTIHPFDPVYQATYERILAAVPKGDFQLLKPITIPYTEFAVSNFTVSADIGAEVQITLNGNRVGSFVATSTLTQFPIKLALGRNYLQATSPTEQASVLVAATPQATFWAGWAAEWFFNVERYVTEMRNQLNSKFGLRSIENQLLFQDLLPGARMMRILAGKLAIRGLLNEGGSTRAVDDFATAITGTTPVVVRQEAAPVLEPIVYPVVRASQDFGGFEFHLWVQNLCAAAYTTFLHLMDNLPTEIANLEQVTDDRIQLTRNGFREVHRFDFDAEGCSMIDVLVNFLGCMSRIKVWARMNFKSRFFLCFYTYNLDECVDKPLACNLLDSGIPLDETPDPRPTPPDPHTMVDRLDSCEESDPYGASEGWLGLPLTYRLDDGRTLDTRSGKVSATCEDAACAFDRPQATMATSRLMDVAFSLSGRPVGF